MFISYVKAISCLNVIFNYPQMLNSLETKKKSTGPDGSKEMNFNVLLKVSVAQIHEKSFKEETVNKIYELLLGYLSSQSHRVAFVELVFMSCQKVNINANIVTQLQPLRAYSFFLLEVVRAALLTRCPITSFQRINFT